MANDVNEVLDIERNVVFRHDVDLGWEKPYGDEPYFIANLKFPDELVQERFGDTLYRSFKHEYGEIRRYYKIYKKGAKFTPDRINSGKADIRYLNAKLRYKKVATLIDKQSRFLFGAAPDIDVEYDGDIAQASQETKDMISKYQKLLNNVFQDNLFTKQLMQSAKDTFVGKRVACVINFNDIDGITIEFINSLRFVYELSPGNANKLEKFSAYTLIIEDDDATTYVKEKNYELVDIYDGDEYVRTAVILNEAIYDDKAQVVRTLYENYELEGFTQIPVVIVTNDGLLEEIRGVSDVEKLFGYEELYSMLANADLDALRLGMNPIKYTVDMTNESTGTLPIGPGAYWDLWANWEQNDGHASPQVGLLEQDNKYSEALDTSLERIKASMYDELDIPDVTLSTLQGTITSGKALKAIYWGLIVRCEEKMKTWGPSIVKIAEIIIEGAKLNPAITARYLDGETITSVAYRIEVESNYPLPEDDAEEQELDMAKVTNQVMSRKSYIKRWGNLSEKEADEELEQIILEEASIELALESAKTLAGATSYPSDDTEYENPLYKYFKPKTGKNPTEPATVDVTEGD